MKYLIMRRNGSGLLPGLPLCLACDSSPYGVGAELSHVMPDGAERQQSALSVLTATQTLHPFLGADTVTHPLH